MERHDPPPPDDFELSDLENESFLPDSGATPRHVRRRPSRLTSWMPPRMQKALHSLSKIKIMIILLGVFIMFAAVLTWLNKEAVAIEVPLESKRLSEELAGRFSNSPVPNFVLAYAPLVFLEKSDEFYPSDLGVHLTNTFPALNFTPVETEALDLSNLDTLNELGGEDIFLTHHSGGEDLEFLHGQAPSERTLRTESAISAVIIIVEKPEAVIDAFYMYFYSYNQGPTVFGHELGNHMGDWEQNMIRFKDGTPTHIWYSQHEYGEAFLIEAVERVDNRPIVFSARGSHANYATRGKHDLHLGNELIPENLVFDHTSQGHLWDPTLSAYYYTYSTETEKFTAESGDSTEGTPVNYLYFNGKWGDQELTDDMPEQSSFHGFHKFTSGPQGPLFKHLDREDVCLPHGIPCEVNTKRVY